MAVVRGVELCRHVMMTIHLARSVAWDPGRPDNNNKCGDGWHIGGRPKKQGGDCGDWTGH